MLAARWRLRPHEPERVAALSREADLPPLVAQLLLNRGIACASAASLFLDGKMSGLHDPEGLPGVVEAADRIVSAVKAGRRIVIYGDYDVDGVCGTSILWGCLKLAGATDVHYYIPHRVDEGYGVGSDAIRKLAVEGKASLIVTVDCGISAVAEARLARELGVELIVTDHHTIGPELPEADVLVHPGLPDSGYPFAGLCGCGVAFKLAWQVAKSFGDGKRASPHLRKFLVDALAMVALATVADMMPLIGENRILVRHGLKAIRAEPSAGLKALIQVAKAGGREITSGTISFSLAPRINAAGRLARAMEAVELLTTTDDKIAEELAGHLESCNEDRKRVEQAIVEEAKRMIEARGGLDDRRSIVLACEGWHPGVIGIVASRLVEVYHRPAIVVALRGEHGQGSARSIVGLDLYRAIAACSEGLTGFGGHAAAAGIRIPTAAVAAFAERFDAHCRFAIAPERFEKELCIDAEVPLGVLTAKVVDQIASMEPFGIGNPRPLLVANRVRVAGDPRAVGGGKHLQIKFSQGGSVVKAIAFGKGDRAGLWSNGTSCSVAFHPSINEWNGRREVQLEVKDVQVHEAAVHVASA